MAAGMLAIAVFTGTISNDAIITIPQDDWTSPSTQVVETPFTEKAGALEVISAAATSVSQLHQDTYTNRWGIDRMGVPAAWDATHFSPVLVAALDTGIVLDAQFADRQGRFDTPTVAQAARITLSTGPRSPIAHRESILPPSSRQGSPQALPESLPHPPSSELTRRRTCHHGASRPLVGADADSFAPCTRRTQCTGAFRWTKLFITSPFGSRRHER